MLAQVSGIMPLRPKPPDDREAHAHIREESQALGGVYLFLGQPAGVVERLLDVLPLEVRIALEDLLDGGAVRDLPDDHGDRDA